jgi:hypothetical protein
MFIKKATTKEINNRPVPENRTALRTAQIESKISGIDKVRADMISDFGF